MNRTILASLILLAGCSTVPTPAPKPGVQVVYQEVRVPVAIACVGAKDIPTEPPKIAGQLTGDARRDLDTTAASATRLRAWGKVMYAMLGGCVKP